MHSVNLIAKTIPVEEWAEFNGDLKEGVCCLTGQLSEKTLPRKELLTSSFTDSALLIRPDSKMVSLDAFLSLKWKWERMSSWWCDGNVFQKLTRQDVRRKVLSEDKGKGPWIGYATTSYKKHGSLRTQINYGNKNVWLFESILVDCSNKDLVNFMWSELNVYLRLGVPRPVLETLEESSFLIKKIGLKKWVQLKEWGLPVYKSPLYQFICYLLPSQEELKNESRSTL